MLFLLIKSLTERLNDFGKIPLCNLNPEHGMWIGNFCLPLCARCTGLMLGILISSFLFIFIIRKQQYKIMYHIIFISLAIPCICDSILQYFFYIESNLIRRVITGILLGISIVFSICYFVNYLEKNKNID